MGQARRLIKMDSYNVNEYHNNKQLSEFIPLEEDYQEFAKKKFSQKQAVEEVLKNHLNLRNVENRSLVYKLAKQLSPRLGLVACVRLCAHIQNTERKYEPETNDKRFSKEKYERRFYSK